MSGTIVKTCTPCKETEASKFQDKEYGKNMRVFNKMKTEKATGAYRCTVCGAIR